MVVGEDQDEFGGRDGIGRRGRRRFFLLQLLRLGRQLDRWVAGEIAERLQELVGLLRRDLAPG